MWLVVKSFAVPARVFVSTQCMAVTTENPEIVMALKGPVFEC